MYLVFWSTKPNLIKKKNTCYIKDGEEEEAHAPTTDESSSSSAADEKAPTETAKQAESEAVAQRKAD